MAAVTVDPADGLRLTAPRLLGEWATAGNTDGWTIANADAVNVANGALSVTSKTDGTAIDASLSAITSGPSLDYGYFSYVQTRLQVPADYSGDVTFSFGTTVVAGFAGNRQFTIPAAQVIKDGQFHVYRLDVGLQPWWKDTLRDMRISLAGGATAKTTAIDYVEVGDRPNDTFVVNATNLNMAPDVTAATRQSVESKHFVFWYDPAVNPGRRTNWATMAKNALHMAETSQQVYVNKLGFKDLNHWAGSTPTKFNIVSWYGGYWSGGDHLNMDTSGLQDESSGNAMPHEIGHAFDSQNGAWLAGGHWESHANWYREQWVNHYAEYFATNLRSAITPNALQYSNLHLDNSRLIYHDYRLLTPLQFYASSLGLDANTAAKLWYQGSKDQTAFDKLATVLPTGANIKDVAGKLMKYWPTLDFPSGPYIKAFQWPTAAAKAEWDYATTSYLKPVADKTATFQVPAERAPEKYAYMTHVLTPTSGSTSVSVTLSGLPSTDVTADWRFTLIALAADGTTRYSETFGNGQTASLSVLPTDTKVVLQVVATPGSTTLNLDAKHNTRRDAQDALRLTYPYEVTMTGATPATGAALRIAYPRGSGAFRTNPDGTAGGWVDATASVASTAYVAAGAQVLGTAKVQGTARVLDFATVSGNATVSGSAVVSGYAVVRGSSTVTGNARVRDHAIVEANTVVRGNAVVEQYALVNGDLGTATITDNAVVRGVAQVQGGTIAGTAIADYDYTFNWNLADGTHSNNHPYDADFYDYYERTQTKPRGLLASYRINESAGGLLFDEFGALNAQLRGTPNRVNDTTLNSNAINLDGGTQYAVLDRSLAELTDGTYAMWVNPATAAVNQPLLYIGSGANSLQWTARDVNGFSRLTMVVGGVTRQLVSTAAVAANAWTHLAVTFSNGIATLYVNGVASGTATGLRPADVLTSDAFQVAEAVYLGRNAAGELFAGKLDDVRVYNVSLSPAEIASEVRRSGATIGTLYADKLQTLAGAVVESGVHDGLVRTISAWVKPNASPAVTSNGASYYQPIVDATSERFDTGYGQGLGINNGKFVARLAGTTSFNGQMWDTGVAVSVGQWQKVALTLSGSLATLYVNDRPVASRAYTTSASTVFSKNYHVGYGQTTTDAASRTFFDGQIYDLRISDRVVAPAAVPGPLAQYNADETAGTTLADASPNGRNGTLVGNATFATGRNGNALTLTGGYARLPNGIVSGASDFTVATWVNPTSNPSWARVFDFGTGTSNYMFLTANPGGTNRLRFAINVNGAGEQQINSTSVLPTNAWTHVAVTLVGNVGTIYVNGVAVSTNSNITARPFGLGQTTNNYLGQSQFPDSTYQGKIDDFRVYGSGLSASAISALYTSAAGPTIATPAAANVSGATATLSVLGASAAGEAALGYTWQVVGNPPGPVTFTANGTNGAKNTVARFAAAGTYQLRLTVADPDGQIATSTVSVTVGSTPASVSAGIGDLIAAVPRQFAAYDGFGVLLPSGGVTWSASVGTITATGLYTPPATGATTATITATIGTASVSTTVNVVAPRAWYKADAASSTALVDASGNNRNGTLTGSYAYAAGKIANALRLTGGNASLPAGVITGLNEVTIAAWVNPTSNPVWARVFDFGTGTANYMFLTANPGTSALRFAINAGGTGEQVVNGPALATNAWSHVAVTIAANGDGTYTGTLYVNGVAAASNVAMTATAATLGNTTLNYLGKSQFSGDNAYAGAIDDVRIYAAAAPADAIAALYAAGNAYATAAPSAVTAVASAGPQVSVSWADNAAAEVGYVVERAMDAAFASGLTTISLPADATTYADASVVAGQTYYYRVSAVLAGGTPTASAGPASVTVPVVAVPPTSAFSVNDGSAQRSRIDSLTVTFDKVVTFGSGALVLSGVGGVVPYTLTPQADGRSFVITFAGNELDDGRYTLHIEHAAVSAADGAIMAVDADYGFFRLFGDVDGDAGVSINDFNALSSAFGTTAGNTAFVKALDYDNDDGISINDFNAFSTRFGRTL